MKEITVSKGEVIFHEGDTNTEMYIIKEGRIRISKQTLRGETDLVVLGRGAFFGEMSLIDSKPRSATATAIEKSTLLIINRETLENQLKEIPEWLLRIFEVVIERLRETNRRLEILLFRGEITRICEMIRILFSTQAEITSVGKMLEYEFITNRISHILGCQINLIQRVLKQLKQLGIIDYGDTTGERSQVLLLREEELRKFCNYLAIQEDLRSDPKHRYFRVIDNPPSLRLLRKLQWIVKRHGSKTGQSIILQHDLLQSRLREMSVDNPAVFIQDWNTAGILANCPTTVAGMPIFLIDMDLLQHLIDYLDMRKMLEEYQKKVKQTRNKK